MTIEMVIAFFEKGGLLAVAVGLFWLVGKLIDGTVMGKAVHEKIVASKDAQIEAARKDCEFYREIAFRNLRSAERTVSVVAPEVAAAKGIPQLPSVTESHHEG